MVEEKQMMEFFCRRCDRWVSVECGGETAPACPSCGGRELVPAPGGQPTVRKAACTCCCQSQKGDENG